MGKLTAQNIWLYNTFSPLYLGYLTCIYVQFTLFDMVTVTGKPIGAELMGRNLIVNPKRGYGKWIDCSLSLTL